MTSKMRKRFHFTLGGGKAHAHFSTQSLLSWVALAAFFAGMAFLGWGAAVAADGYLRSVNLKALEARSASPAEPGDAVAETGPAGMELKRFTEVNPFRANLPPGGGPAPKAVEQTDPGGTASLGDLTLVGTLPPEGAFFNNGEKLVLLLRGDSVEGYELAEVHPEGALFHKGEEEVFLRLRFSGKAPRTTVRKPSARSPAASSGKDNIQAATPEKEGALDRELVNQLLMNPFEELKKLRLRPRMENGEAVGIEVRYIRKDSLFKQLGVSRGDVIQGVNGIQMRSMNDVANAISSLMGGSRFDVTVLRDSKPVTLSYTVR